MKKWKTWKEFKEKVEGYGVKDSDVIDYVDTPAGWNFEVKKDNTGKIRIS